MINKEKNSTHILKKADNYLILLMTVSLMLYTGCSPKQPEISTSEISINEAYPPLHPPAHAPSKHDPDAIQQLILEEFKQWEGTPHKMGGNSKKGIDCSGFAYHIYSTLFHINVPRTTKHFFIAGRKIKKSQLQPGDLVAFSPHSYPRHVGIYAGNNKFIHASTSKGVIMSDLDHPYWKKHYVMSRRILTRHHQ